MLPHWHNHNVVILKVWLDEGWQPAQARVMLTSESVPHPNYNIVMHISKYHVFDKEPVQQ